MKSRPRFNYAVSKTPAITLSNFLAFLPQDANYQLNALRKYIRTNELSQIEISEKIFLIFQKIKNRKALDQNDINILEAELKKIRHMNLHDVIVYVLYTLKTKIYNDYKQKMNGVENTIENHFFDGNKLTNINAFEEYDNGNYIDILNFHKIKIFNYENYNNTVKLFALDDQMMKDQKFNVQLWINQLIILGKIPAEVINSFEQPSEAKELDEILNSKHTQNQNENQKRLLIFSKKNSNKKNYGDTFLASDGEKISYATKTRGQWFIASHQANEVIDKKNFAEESKIHTNKKVSTYANSDQDYWNAFSNSTIDATSKLFADQQSKYRDLETLLRFLGEKRQVVAQQLNHGRADGRTGEYGRFRSKICFEIVDKNQVWKELFPKVKARIQALKNQFISEKVNKFIRYYYPNGSTHVGYFDKNFRIEFTSTDDCYYFTYPKIENEKELTEVCKKLQPLLTALFEWDGKDINEFIKGIGRLSYELYRQLPFYLGTNAIVSWLTRSVALYKGIELGPLKDNEDDLPLDWEAFLTFDREQYANWFLNHAYKEPKFKTNQKNVADKRKTEQIKPLIFLFSNTNHSSSVNKKSEVSPNNLSDSINLLTTSIKKLAM